MAGWINKGGGKAESSVLHRLRHERFHLFEFFGSGCAVDIAEYSLTHLGCPHIGSNVQWCPSLFQSCEIFAKRAPISFEVILIEARLERSQRKLILWRYRSAFSRDLSGDALQDRKSTRLNSSHANISYA